MEKYNNIDIYNISDRLKELRYNSGLKQKEIAESINVSKSYMCLLENLRTRRKGKQLTFSTVKAIAYLCDIFGCSIDYLLKIDHSQIKDEYLIKYDYIISLKDKDFENKLIKPFSVEINCPYEISLRKISENISIIRKRLNKTQKDIKQKLIEKSDKYKSYDNSYISALEHLNQLSRTSNAASLCTLLKLCNVYDISIEYLLNGGDYMGGSNNMDYKLMTTIIGLMED